VSRCTCAPVPSMMVLVLDDSGVWLAAGRLNVGRLVLPNEGNAGTEAGTIGRAGVGHALAAHGRCRCDHDAVIPRLPTVSMERRGEWAPWTL
jgi:hypothetical protein